MSLLKVNHVGRILEGRNLLKNINFEQEEFTKLAIAGETGSGKTTLLKIIAGLSELDEGVVLLDDERVPGPMERLIPGHPSIGYLSQHFELRNYYNVSQELERTNLLEEARASELYNLCRIDYLMDRQTMTLSGGERQRVALAKILNTAPRLLLLDEPFSNLDTLHKVAIKNVIADLGNHWPVTCILVSHDAVDTLSWADQILVLQNGKIVQQGTPEEIYRHPVSEYCAGLFGEYNLINEGILRPEQIKLSVEETMPLKGIMVSSNYFGSYYIVTVRAEGHLLKCRLSTLPVAIGETVYLSFDSNDLHFIR